MRATIILGGGGGPLHIIPTVVVSRNHADSDCGLAYTVAEMESARGIQHTGRGPHKKVVDTMPTVPTRTSCRLNGRDASRKRAYRVHKGLHFRKIIIYTSS